MKPTKKNVLKLVAAEIAARNKAEDLRIRLGYMMGVMCDNDQSPEFAKVWMAYNRYYYTLKNTDLVKLIALLES
jgi:hypothetical protein